MLKSIKSSKSTLMNDRYNKKEKNNYEKTHFNSTYKKEMNNNKNDIHQQELSTSLSTDERLNKLQRKRINEKIFYLINNKCKCLCHSNKTFHHHHHHHLCSYCYIHHYHLLSPNLHLYHFHPVDNPSKYQEIKLSIDSNNYPNINYNNQNFHSLNDIPKSHSYLNIYN